jgi:hypothetical protein
MWEHFTMRVLKRYTWLHWVLLSIVVAGGLLSILNRTLGWDQRWISISVPVVVLVVTAVAFRLMWKQSDPQNAAGASSHPDDSR